jgi:hypothetical protein
MSYAIIGFGNVGEALARMFARKNIEVAIASTRPPEALAPLAKAIGPTIIPKSLQDALKAEIVILAGSSLFRVGEFKAAGRAIEFMDSLFFRFPRAVKGALCASPPASFAP